MPKTWLIAVPAGRWQLAGIQRAQDLGLSVLAIDQDPSAPGFQLAEKHSVVNINHEADVLRTIEEHQITPSAAVSIASEAGMAAVGAINSIYSLNGPNHETTIQLTDKSRQRARWDAADLPNPMWKVCRNHHEAERAVLDITPPLIITPSQSAGSRAVSRIEDPGRLDNGA